MVLLFYLSVPSKINDGSVYYMDMYEKCDDDDDDNDDDDDDDIKPLWPTWAVGALFRGA
jgi:hypothetical protein